MAMTTRLGQRDVRGSLINCVRAVNIFININIVCLSEISHQSFQLGLTKH